MIVNNNNPISPIQLSINEGFHGILLHLNAVNFCILTFSLIMIGVNLKKKSLNDLYFNIGFQFSAGACMYIVPFT